MCVIIYYDETRVCLQRDSNETWKLRTWQITLAHTRDNYITRDTLLESVGERVKTSSSAAQGYSAN